MHTASCQVLALADGVHLEAEIFEHSVNENAATLKRKVGSIYCFLRTVPHVETLKEEMHG